jgi:N-methylhydantoinase B
MDDVGPDTEPVEARVTVTIGDGRITLDWAGSGPQREAGCNSYLHYTAAYSIAAVKSVTLAAAPQNEGIIRCIEVKAPPGSFFNPTRPAPCGGRAVVSHRIYEVAMARRQGGAPSGDRRPRTSSIPTSAARTRAPASSSSAGNR